MTLNSYLHIISTSISVSSSSSAISSSGSSGAALASAAAATPYQADMCVEAAVTRSMCGSMQNHVHAFLHRRSSSIEWTTPLFGNAYVLWIQQRYKKGILTIFYSA